MRHCCHLIIPALYEPLIVERDTERHPEEVLLHEAIGLGAALAYLEGGVYAIAVALEGQAEAEGKGVVIDIGALDVHMVFAIVGAEAVGDALQVVVYAEGIGGICTAQAHPVAIGHGIDHAEVAELAPLHCREVEAGAPLVAVHELRAYAVGHGQLKGAFGTGKGVGGIFLQAAAEVEVGEPILVAKGAEVLAEGKGAAYAEAEVGIELVLVLQACLPVYAAHAGELRYIGIDGVCGIDIGEYAGIAYGAEAVTEIDAEAETFDLAGKACKGVVEGAIAIVGIDGLPYAGCAYGIVEVIIYVRLRAEAEGHACMLAEGEAYGEVGQRGHAGAAAYLVGRNGGEGALHATLVGGEEQARIGGRVIGIDLVRAGKGGGYITHAFDNGIVTVDQLANAIARIGLVLSVRGGVAYRTGLCGSCNACENE